MSPQPKRPNARTYDQPVRVYKIIALSFLAITAILFGLILFLSSKRAVITVEASSSPVDTKTSIVVADAPTANQVQGKIMIVTSTESKKFSPTGSKEEEGTSGGTVTLTNETSADRSLVATTRLLSPEGVLFRLVDRVSIPAGGTVEAEVYADQPGKASDIAPTKFTIPGLSESAQEVIYANSSEPMSGGVKTIGVLSSNDVKTAEATLKETMIANVQAQLQAENAGMELSVQEQSSSFSSDVELGEEVSEFTLTGELSVVAVVYDTNAVAALAGEMLQNRAVDEHEIVTASTDKPSVSLQSIDVENKMATLDVFAEGTASLNVDSNSLSKEAFFGLSKDEVRRSLLKLDHVRGVEVEFSPAWTLSVPSVHEHVRVIVKTVE